MLILFHNFYSNYTFLLEHKIGNNIHDYIDFVYHRSSEVKQK